jgi:hypothetical protein
LREMKQLRSLHIHIRSRRNEPSDTATDWLQEIHKNADISDFVHTPNGSHIYVWFGNRP